MDSDMILVIHQICPSLMMFLSLFSIYLGDCFRVLGGYMTGLHKLNFLCTTFRTFKTVLGTHLCTWEIMHIKQLTCMLLIVTQYGVKNCTKLVLKRLAAKSGLSISVLCIAPFL